MLKKLLSLLSDALVYGSSTILAQLINFLLLPLYTQYLTPQDYGVVAMLAIVSLVYVPIANLGMSNAIFRRFNLVKDEAERLQVLGVGLVTVVGATLIFGAICLAASRPLGIALMGERGFGHLVAITVVYAMLESVTAIPMAALRADRRVKAVAVASLGKLLVMILVTVLLVAVVQLGVLGVVLGNLIGGAVGLALFVAFTHRQMRPAFDRALWRAMLKYGAPFVPHQIQAVGLVMVGQYIVRRDLGLHDAGLFNIALKFALPLAFVIDAVQKAWVPFKFQIHGREENPAAFFRTAITYYTVAMAYLWVGVAAWGPELLRLMTEAQFHTATLLVAAVATISMCRGMRFMLTTGMEFNDDMRAVPVITFVGLAVVIAGCLLLVPLWGASGAAMGTAAGWCVMAALGYMVAQRKYRVVYQWPIVAGCLLVAAGMVSITYASQLFLDLPGRLAVALAVSIVYPTIALAILCTSTEDRHRVTRTLRRLRSRLLARGDAKASPPALDDAAVQSNVPPELN